MPGTEHFTVHLKASQTPCQRLPERCGRRELKGLVLDADGVIWHIDGAIASSVCGPFKTIDKETVEGHTGSCHGPQAPRGWDEPASRGVRVKLLPGLRDLLGLMHELGIPVFVSSLNTEGSVKGLLKAFGLLGDFVEVRDNWDPKEKSVREMAEKHKIAPCDMAFVDDTVHNVDSVSRLGVLGLHMGQDIKSLAAILDYIR